MCIRDRSYAAIQKHLEEGGFEDVGGEFTYIANDLKDVEPAPVSYTHLDVYKRQSLLCKNQRIRDYDEF